MPRRSNQAGFTLIELMIVVAIIAIIASVAIPRLMAARLSANESAAISTLRSLASAQAQLQSSAAVDSDADGGGEYGYFGELSGAVPLRVNAAGAPAIGAVNTDELNPPVLSTAFGNVQADGAGDGVVVRSGYVFKVWLPAATVGGATPGVGEAPAGGSPAGLPNSDNCEILWAAYAWPFNASRSGNRTFFINQEGDLLQFNNRTGVYTGLAASPPFDAAFDPAGVGGAALDMASPIAVGVAGNDGNVWTAVQ